MTAKFRAHLLLLVLSLFFLAAILPAQAQSTKPITFKGLTEALKIGGLSSGELIEQVNRRGVDFDLTPERESELKSVGATPDLLRAIRTSRGGSPGPVSVPVQVEPSNGGNHGGHHSDVSSMRQVKKLFIEKMPNDLDEYIKTEISRQMPGKLAIVLRRDEAEAIMSGTANNKSGRVRVTNVSGSMELWNGEAGDMGIHLKSLHGGPKDVAKRLVSSLKKAVD